MKDQDQQPHQLFDLMQSRRSVRRFRPDPVPRELLAQLFEAAVTAPSASNKQPWRFFVISSTDEAQRIPKMAAAVREATTRIAKHIPEESQSAFLAYGDYFTRFESAPSVIVPLCRALPVLSNLATSIDDPTRDVIARMEHQSGVIGTSLAIQNLLLMAHALGLGASGMTGPLVAEPALRTILDVPSGWTIVSLIPVGFPAEEPNRPDRKSIDKVVRWL
jgi:nitroreductase